MMTGVTTTIPIPLLFLVIFITVWGGCASRKQTAVEPDPVVFKWVEPLKQPGKIYTIDELLYVVDTNSGVHIYDIDNLRNPIYKGYIQISGNEDIAIKDHILYADSGPDLVAIDIEYPREPRETKRIKNVFPEPSRPSIIGTILLFPLWLLAMGLSGGGEYEAAESSVGIGGSLSRFTVVDRYLYVLGGGDLKLFDISNPSDPVHWTAVEIGWDIETIHPYEDKLFIGGRDGMYIFDNTDPSQPREISRFGHITSCDPVVVEGDFAYVTLRGGNACGGDSDVLQVIDISNLMNPSLASEFPMSGPYGLGIDDGLLVVCDGDDGLKLFDASDSPILTPISEIHHCHPYDVVMVDQRAIVSAADGLRLYIYKGLDVFEEASRIPIYVH